MSREVRWFRSRCIREAEPLSHGAMRILQGILAGGVDLEISANENIQRMAAKGQGKNLLDQLLQVLQDLIAAGERQAPFQIEPHVQGHGFDLTKIRGGELVLVDRDGKTFSFPVAEGMVSFATLPEGLNPRNLKNLRIR